MTDEPNLYDILGVPSDASQDEIKAAYKSIAQRGHPDKDPSEDMEREFRMAKAAYEILSDTERRDRYDSGDGTAKPVSDDAVAQNRLLGMFQQMVEANEYTDVVAKIRDSVKSNLEQMRTDITKMEGKISRMEKNRKRVHRRTPERNMFEAVVVQQIERAINSIKSIEYEIVIADLVLKQLDEYDCEVESRTVMRPQRGYLGGIGPGGW